MASPPNAAPATAAPVRRMSSAARIVGVFVSPGKTFADIVAEPHFIQAYCVIAVLALGSAYALLHRVGAYALARQGVMMSASGRVLSPDQLNKAIAAGAKVLSISFYAAPLTQLVLLLFLALIFLGIANFLLGHEATYKQALAITVHAYLAQALYVALLILVLYLMPNPQAMQITNPLGTNLGYFLDSSTTSPFLYAMATRLDLFTVWTIVLLSIGLSKLGRKGKFAGAFWAVFSLWLFYALVVSGITAAFTAA